MQSRLAHQEMGFDRVRPDYLGPAFLHHGAQLGNHPAIERAPFEDNLEWGPGFPQYGSEPGLDALGPARERYDAEFDRRCIRIRASHLPGKLEDGLGGTRHRISLQ